MSEERARYALERISPGGLLLDFESGELFVLNESATYIWELWLTGVSTTQIAASLTRQHAVSPAAADAYVAGALATTEGVPSAPGEFFYARSGDGYLFSRAGTPILRIEGHGEALERIQTAPMSESDLIGVLFTLSPKLLALRGHFVLHASAVIVKGEVIAFSGESGAGKTTTARALVSRGAAPLTEDKLILRETAGRFQTATGIEKAVRDWVTAAARMLTTATRVSCASLDEQSTSSTAFPLREIGFLDATRRDGDTIAAAPLSELHLAAAIFRNSFYGSDTAHDWRLRVAEAARLARSIPGYSLRMPGTIDRLDTAAEDLVRRGTLRS